MGFRRRSSRTITVDAEVDIDDFDDEAVLERASEIVERLNTKPPDSQDDESRRLMQKIARLMGIRLDTLPPVSTAAKITTATELKDYLAGKKIEGLH